MFKRDHLFAAAFILLWTVVLWYFGEISLLKASIVSTAAWYVTYFLFKLLMRFTEEPVPETSPWDALDLDQHLHRETLQRLFAKHDVKGSMNVRNGRIFPVVNPDLLSPLAKRLRGSVALIKMHPRAGADLFYMEDNIVGMADLTVMEIEQAASVMEREVEDRNSSRKLYRGFGEDEFVSMARTVVADYVRNADTDGGDNIILSSSIRRGEFDDHPMMTVALKTIRFIVQVKGTHL